MQQLCTAIIPTCICFLSELFSSLPPCISHAAIVAVTFKDQSTQRCVLSQSFLTHLLIFDLQLHTAHEDTSVVDLLGIVGYAR
ncbi:hypothetical protein BJ165DRAFT_1481970 [Panaeolus papilionaceus]|nr:hypothetical protein BJ165DRAFT_1481970 [Panaeolus papilionaceus]